MTLRLSPPIHPRPTDARVKAAKLAVGEILLDYPASSGVIEIPSDCLVDRLRQAGHVRAAAEYAIYELVETGLLEPHFPSWEPVYPISTELLARAATYQLLSASINSHVNLTAKDVLWTSLADEQPQSAVAMVQAGHEPAKPQRSQRLAELPDDAMLNHLDLAKLLALNPEVLRKRLDRWRAKNKEGWQHVHEPASREPKYLYRIGAVRELLDAAIASAETSG